MKSLLKINLSTLKMMTLIVLFATSCKTDEEVIASFTCGNPLSVNHKAGTVAPVNKTVNYGTVTNIPGETLKCWISQNLGSEHQAFSVSDGTEASAGWYWQFNHKQGFKHDGAAITPSTSWISSISDSSNWLLANDPCTLELGNNWRLPSKTEWHNVAASVNWTDWNGPWNSGLKLHAAGYLNRSNGSLGKSKIWGHYWSSDQADGQFGFYLHLSRGSCDEYDFTHKASGLSVRCLRDN